MSKDAESASAWLTGRKLVLPAADAADIAKAVRGLEAAIDAAAAKLDPMQLPEPFQQCLARLAEPGVRQPLPPPAVEHADWSLDHLAAGHIGSEEWVRRCLGHIETQAPGRLAWLEVNAETALREARALEDRKSVV